MAFRTWAKLLAATLGVGALAGASQLGMAYGLGILRLTRVLDVTTRDQWTAQLVWVAWLPMLAAVVGALAGVALLRRWSPGGPVRGAGTGLALAFAAALGAAVVVPLTMQPARTAQVAGVSPVVVIAICAGLGALVGVFAAWAALAQAIARWSIVTMGAAVWVIALISVAPSLAPSDPLPAIRLGVFDAGFLAPAVTQRTALATMPALALVIGALLGWAARRREFPIVTIALAGLPGPALLTIAYLIAGPGAGDDQYQVVPYWAAMTATGAGVLGSVLAAVLGRGAEQEDADDQDGEAPQSRQLPKRTNQQESAIAAAGGETSSDPPLPQRERTTDRPAGTDTGGGAGLGGPAAPKPGRPRWRARRSSVADAFIGRPAARPAGPAAGRPSGDDDDFQPGWPGGDQDRPPRSSDAPWSPAGAVPHQGGRPEPRPYVPEPAVAPLPPGVGTSGPEPTPTAGGRLGRGLRPFGRDRTAEPVTPQPTAISAPLPQPQPVTPPLAVTPVPDPAAGSAGGKRRSRGAGKDDDYVDWVSGLGK